MIKIFFRLAVVLSLILVLTTQAFAAPAAPAKPVPDSPALVPSRVTAVAVQSEGDDSIGARLGTALKERFNVSSLFKLSSADEPKIVLMVTTKPEFASRPSVGSVYVVIWAYSQADGYLYMLLDKQVGTVSAEEVNGLVEELVQKTDGIGVKYASLLKR